MNRICLCLISMGAFAVAMPAFADWGSNRETVAENQTWIFRPDSPIDGNPRILNGKRALIVTLHGCAQSATDLKQFGNWEPTARSYGLVVAIPDVNQGVIQGCWDYDEALDKSQHIKQILKLVEELKKPERRLDIDPQQVYIVGLSSGGAAALQAACTAPDVFAGVGAIAGPSVGSDQQRATDATPTDNIPRAAAKCAELAGTKRDALKTQIAALAFGDRDKNGDGPLPQPFPLQGGTPVIDVQWTKDNADIAAQLSNSPPLDSRAHSIQGGKAEERISVSGGKPAIALVKMFGIGHAWAAGSGDTSLGGGNWIHKIGFNYPAYATEWFFANNRRLAAIPASRNRLPEITGLSVEASGSSIIVTGNARDADGSVKRVNLELADFRNTDISVDANGNFRYAFDNLGNGRYTIRATAFDNQEVRSAPRQKTVRVERGIRCP